MAQRDLGPEEMGVLYEICDRMARKMRLNGCRAPVHPRTNICMRCGLILDAHPPDIRCGRSYYYLAEGEKDEYSNMLEILS